MNYVAKITKDDDEQVAKEAGISKQAYRSFETPFANPTFNTLSNIAKALGKNLKVRLV